VSSDPAVLSHVAIIYRDTQVDLALPFAQPINWYIDNVVDALAGAADMDSIPGGQWTLGQLDAPIDPARSLADARINDGATLRLWVVTPTEPYRPLAGDVVDAMAAAPDRASRPLDAVAARRTGLVGLVAGGLFLCAAQWWMWAANHLSVIWTIVGAAGAVLALAAMWSAASRYRAFDAAAAWAVVWLAAIAAAGQWFPFAQQGGSPGLPHLAAAAVAVCVGAVCALVITGAHLGMFSAVVAGAGTVAVVAVVAQSTHVASSAIAAGVLVAGLIGLSAMPRLTMWLAWISLPPRPVIGRDVEVASEITDAELTALQTRATRAARLRSALTVVAGATMAAAAAWTLDTHSPYLRFEIAIVACTAVILVLRGRSMPDRAQAYALLAAAAFTVFGSAGRLILARPTGWWPVVVISIVAVATAVFVISTVMLSSQTTAPTAPSWADRLEAVAIVLVVPLCVWVAGVFAVIRDAAFG
jgi:type VII secretion integral membrane protein EccD